MSRKRTINIAQHLQRIHRLPCAECDNTTRHEVLACVDDEHRVEDMFGSEEYEIVACLGCEKVSFRQSWQSSEHLEYDYEEGLEVTAEHPELFQRELAWII